MDHLRRIERLLADMGDPLNSHLPADLQVEILLRERAEALRSKSTDFSPEKYEILKQRIAHFEAASGLKLAQWHAVALMAEKIKWLARDAKELADATSAAAMRAANKIVGTECA